MQYKKEKRKNKLVDKYLFFLFSIIKTIIKFIVEVNINNLTFCVDTPINTLYINTIIKYTNRYTKQ